MRNYISQEKIIGRFYIRVYQILGSSSVNPSKTDPILYAVYDTKKNAWNDFGTIFHDEKYGFMGDISTLRRECKFPVGDQRFAFYDRMHRRLDNLAKKLTIQAFPEYRDRLCK